MATHSSILAWRIPWTEEPGGLQSTGRKESDSTERLHFHFHVNIWVSQVALVVKNPPAKQGTRLLSLSQEDSPGEGNGNPLQYSCLEDSMDRGTWWAIVHWVTKGQT